MLNISSVSSAHLLSLIYASLYVGSIYISRQFNAKGRDDPAVIRVRLVAVSIATALSLTIFTNISSTPFTLLGLIPSSVSVLAHFLSPLLFLGPLTAALISGESPLRPLPAVQLWRNYIIAPITEELVFRACILATYSLVNVPPTKLIFLAPLWFGIAHLHHAYEQITMHRVPVQRALFISLFQCIYTSLFGAHASFLFLYTSSVYPCISSHIFCNIMGFPDLQGELRQNPKRKGVIITAYILGVAAYVYGVRILASQ